MFQCETRLEIHRQSGFSLLEMTLVLGILAIVATTTMTIAQRKMEETITSRTVSELSIAAEAAYECYVAGDCATGKLNWTFGTESEGWKAAYLPETFPNEYGFFPLSGADENTPKAEIRVDMEDAGRAQRVARAFGFSAKGSDTFVVVTLGIPGTESAIKSAISQIETGGALKDQITIGTSRITEQQLDALTNALELECRDETHLRVADGVFQCGDTPAQHCSRNGFFLKDGDSQTSYRGCVPTKACFFVSIGSCNVMPAHKRSGFYDEIVTTCASGDYISTITKHSCTFNCPSSGSRVNCDSGL